MSSSLASRPHWVGSRHFHEALADQCTCKSRAIFRINPQRVVVPMRLTRGHDVTLITTLSQTKSLNDHRRLGKAEGEIPHRILGHPTSDCAALQSVRCIHGRCRWKTPINTLPFVHSSPL